VTGVAGGAIMGDGRVGLILDLEKLFLERTADGAL
jgi:chemotaxis protein histidine kinase CheA